MDKLDNSNGNKGPVAGGVFLALGAIGGALAGVMVGEASAGLLVGLAIGAGLAGLVWYMDSRR